MKQLVQSVRDGDLRLVEIPAPQIGPTEVLVSTSRSVVSPGTERAVRRLASASMFEKARARPDLVRQVLRKARVEGLRSAVGAVQSRLGEVMPLGYSAAGTVLEVGEAVDGVRVGDRVATGAAGHADVQVVSGLLAVPVPGSVDDEAAAFATIGAVALHALRLAEVGPGARVAVLGLGLVGQLTTRLARAAGCEVVGLDVREWAVERVTADLSLVDTGDDTTSAIVEWSKGTGVDAVLVTAATPSSAPIQRAPALARDRAAIVVVGDVGLQLDRRPFYEKELSLRVARSYGPGRYDRSYEDWGVDYPVGHVRWTEGRNLEAVLGLMDRGQLEVDDLITHRFPFREALRAYDLLESGQEPYLAVQLVYDQGPIDRARQVVVGPRQVGGAGIGLIGAGAFARTVLVPGLQTAGFKRLVCVSSASGLSAVRLAERVGFERAVGSAEAVIEDPETDVVVIATAHDSHAGLAAAALRAGKHVFCEKPLALTEDELADVVHAWRSGGCQFWVGLNRRYSASVAEARRHLAGTGPVVITYSVNAGPVAPEHWYGDRRQGGRLLGEMCHFIDTCSALAGSSVRSAHAFAGRRDETLLDPDVVLTLSFDDGSLAAITYASDGYTGTAKERIEVLGRGHTVVIDDFRSVSFDGKQTWSGPQDKGHQALFAAFHKAVVEGDDSGVGEASVSTMAAALAAAGSLLTGAARDLVAFDG